MREKDLKEYKKLVNEIKETSRNLMGCSPNEKCNLELKLDNHISDLESKLNEEKGYEHPEVMEEVYRQYLKGTVMETKLAYRTARDHLLDQFKLKFDIFFKYLKEEDIL